MSLSGGSPRGEDGLHGEWAARDAAPWAVLRYVTRMSRKISTRGAESAVALVLRRACAARFSALVPGCRSS
ncbi:hypothetical protein GN956_G17319 [Arapaima gigas]